MRNTLFTLLLLFVGSVGLAQKTEISIQVSSGLFSFGGKSASVDPNFFINDTQPFYLVNPYSPKSAFSYGFAAQVQRVTKEDWVLGLRIGYDQLSTISHFDKYGAMAGNYKVENGKVIFKNKLIQFNPYFGYRLPLNKFHLDVTAGVNAGYILRSDYTVTFDGQSDFFDSKTKNYYINTELDFGPTLGLATEYKRVGVNATYYYGLVNYMKDIGFSENKYVHSRYIRFGISYRLK